MERIGIISYTMYKEIEEAFDSSGSTSLSHEELCREIDKNRELKEINEEIRLT